MNYKRAQINIWKSGNSTQRYMSEEKFEISQNIGLTNFLSLYFEYRASQFVCGIPSLLLLI